MVTGIDLVKEQLALLLVSSIIHRMIQAARPPIECRINAEDPVLRFLPSPGKIERFHAPGGMGVRWDPISTPRLYAVPPHYDSMIGKLITYGENCDVAIKTYEERTSRMIVEGINVNTEPY
ncbi:hypothetical protein O9929_22805 [Vibrio lentus]|nr:hypothetical protein [Vibrio lentus]